LSYYVKAIMIVYRGGPPILPRLRGGGLLGARLWDRA
jgi:hypothetical protein